MYSKHSGGVVSACGWHRTNANTSRICANSSALPEVAGDAALLFPWDDAAALAVHMTRLAHDPVLRALQIAAGTAHASRFSWSRVADQTLACFERVM